MNSDILNLSNLLLLTFGPMSGYTLWRLLQVHTSPRGWMMVHLLILVVGILGYLLFPHVAGYGITGLWIIFILLPAWGVRLTNHLTRTQQYQRGYRVASLLQWLHPLDGWRESPPLYRALDLGSQGRFDEAAQILERVRDSRTALSRAATCQLYRLRGQWSELRHWIEDDIPVETLAQDSSLMYHYLLTLGETGDLNRMLALCERHQSLLRRNHVLDMARMACLAYGGRKGALLTLYSGALAGFTQPIQESWLATASFAAGQSEEGTTRLIKLRDQSDHLLRQSIERKLARPPIVAQPMLTPESQAVLDRFERELGQEERFREQPRTMQGRAYATYSLIALNITFLLLEELAGGSENLSVLFRLGAFSQPAIAHGEIWRMVTSTFLHYGFIHLAVNLLALYFIGPFVEYWLGVRRYLITYFVAGLGGAALTLLFSDPHQIVVGASGCVMGLLGASAAIHLRGWRIEKARAARKELLEIAVLIVLQTVLDILTPQISLTGHLGGLTSGFIIGLILMPAVPIKATLQQKCDRLT